MRGWLQRDKAFHALLGVERFPAEDAIRRFLHRFTQARTEAFWRPLWKWMLELMEAPKAGFSLDLDSTVVLRAGVFCDGAALLGAVLIYNLLSLYQAPVTRENGYRKPSTMREAVVVRGAILGRKGWEAVVRFSESWGGLKKHIPLIEAALKRGDPIAPLLTREPTPEEKWSELACGGCAI
jgi:hypothetical protein